MLIVFYITATLLFIYILLVGRYLRAWNNIAAFDIQTGFTGRIKVSVIIPARNEEDNIVQCLRSLAAQTYPPELLEIIVVNDHSTDRTEERARAFPAPNIRLINLSEWLSGRQINAYKKKAIEIAIASATGALIVTTDADCTAPPQWIEYLAAFHQKHKAAFIAAPVKLQHTRSLLSVFQSLDFMSLQGITGASVATKIHSMCNGANLAYERAVFYEVGGFEGIDSIASGDDMLLMHKIFKKYPDRVYYLKSRKAIVSTAAAASWKAFFQQRIRWASKADKYEDKRIFAVLVLVYFLNLLLASFFAACLWKPAWLLYFTMLLFAKTIVEFIFVKKVAAFFGEQRLMAYFLLLQPLHILYTIIAGLLGKFGSYEWKDRKVK